MGIQKRDGVTVYNISFTDLSFEIDSKTQAFQEYRQKARPDKFDAFAAEYSWMDEAKYVSHAAPAAMFLLYASNEPFLNSDWQNNISSS